VVIAMLLTRPAQTLLLIIAMIIVAVVIPGCSPQPTRYVSEPLPLPVRPVLPALSANDIACLSDDTYKRLLARDLLRRQYAEELEAIIRATHTVKPDPY
jgi:hypothetical protein